MEGTVLRPRSYLLAGLCYGHYPYLASRMLHSILDGTDWSWVAEWRLAAHEVSQETWELMLKVAAKAPVPTLIYRTLRPSNPGKYVTMRYMLYDPQRPVAPTVSRIMWFDDDSYLKVGPQQAHDWWQTLSRKAAACTVLGSLYVIRQRGKQYLNIPKQPWYGGKALSANHFYRFATGGWWVADLPFLYRWNYPWPELRHNGGDSLLGELCRQQNGSLCQFRDGVAINADLAGRESSSPRRGMTTDWPYQHDTETVTAIEEVVVHVYQP